MTHRNRAVLRRRAAVVAAAALLGWGTAACATGPTAKAEVCEKYDALGDRLGIGAVFGNPVFSAADDLADVADRYEGPEDLSSDAERLGSIADADETSTVELSAATENVSALCGHPLGIGSTYP
ncbi:molybdenum ABC transporter substrate-binding protein [Streptomyces sp. NPDC090106]|uniref:molybdenum ABC transporter substrate-binding protein n=1 Tax=Streptomyces sp. NPDC090106 TaxID=3365946 RepID=UPI0038144BCB